MSERDKDPFVKGEHKIEWLPIKQLSVIWAQSQRELNERHALNIAENFDPEKFGVLSVTKPNGKGVYHIIDGHHRRVAVEKIWGSEQRVPCVVFDAHDPERAAQLFDQINSARRNPQPVELFRVRVTAGNNDEVAVNRIVQRCGFKISFNNQDGGISCVQALLTVYRSHGAEILEMVLNTLRATWPEDRNAPVAHIIRGYGSFLAEFGRGLDFVRLRESVNRKYSPGSLMAAARSGRDLQGGSVGEAIKRLLVVAYNRGKRGRGTLTMKDGAEYGMGGHEAA